MALAPLIIRWGGDASSDLLRQSALPKNLAVLPTRGCPLMAPVSEPMPRRIGQAGVAGRKSARLKLD
jgi:hypothetical protein